MSATRAEAVLFAALCVVGCRSSSSVGPAEGSSNGSSAPRIVASVSGEALSDRAGLAEAALNRWIGDHYDVKDEPSLAKTAPQVALDLSTDLVAWDGTLPRLPPERADQRLHELWLAGHVAIIMASTAAPERFVAAVRLASVLMHASDCGQQTTGFRLAALAAERQRLTTELPGAPFETLPRPDDFIVEVARCTGDYQASQLAWLHRTDRAVGEINLARRRELIETTKIGRNLSAEARIDAEIEVVRKLYADSGALIAGHRADEAKAILKRRAEEAWASKDVYLLRNGLGNQVVDLAESYAELLSISARK